ncbi:MAG: transcriptional repressor [Elusimicrobiaceae bacterium]|nr:transcriptional repressor [Elusimicrobiaceae bacterium]
MQYIQSNHIEEKVTAFKKLCHARSLRVTNQRLEIFRALSASKEHPSVEAVFQIVRKNMPKISLDTIYRTLSSMEEAGVVFRVGLSNRARFDADLTPHYHFVCMECGEVFDVFPQQGQDAFPLPHQVKEFGEVKNVNLQFHGVCHRCRKAGNDVKN